MTDTGFPSPEADLEARFSKLGSLDRSIALTASRPRWTVYGFTFLIAGLAWLWLILVGIELSISGGGAEIGPASGHAVSVLTWLKLDYSHSGWIRWLVAVCTPQVANENNLSLYLVAFAMWTTMSLAMMLPSAAPMLRTYADIADVASAQSKPAVSVSILLIGYLVVWLIFAALAAGLQMVLALTTSSNGSVEPIQGLLGGGLLMLAGVYQFSDIKDACLEKCRNPFATLFGRWSETPRGVFWLGVEQGLFCLGCCWALMLVMFVVGTMNLAWMAFFTLFAVLEKSVRGKVTSRVSGGILLGWGGILFLLSAFGQMA